MLTVPYYSATAVSVFKRALQGIYAMHSCVRLIKPLWYCVGCTGFILAVILVPSK